MVGFQLDQLSSLLYCVALWAVFPAQQWRWRQNVGRGYLEERWLWKAVSFMKVIAQNHSKKKSSLFAGLCFLCSFKGA